MGCKYTVQVWGRHWESIGDDSYSYRMVWQGQWLVGALLALWKASRQGFGCTALEVR